MTSLPRWLRTALLLLVVAATGLFVSVAKVAACPNCKQIISEGPGESGSSLSADGADLARGYNFSILLMLAVPYVLVGGMGAGLWIHQRRRRFGRTA